uniref:VCBS domain-containing protein n=1 Tax=Aliivibrio logei TaxID=688 RepID=UPI000AEE747A
MNKQSDKTNSNNKTKSFSDSGKEKSPIKNKKNKSQRYLARRISLYPQLMLILPSFSFSKTFTPEEFLEEKYSNIESGTLEESNPHHNESLISPLDPIVENKMSNIQPNPDDTNEHTPIVTPSARSSSHLASHAITPIGILPTPVQNHTINQAPAMLVTHPTTLSTPPPQHSQQQAVISGKDSATTTEDVTTHVSGKLTIIDFDRGEAHFSNTDIIGTLGTLHLTDNGAWTYDLNNTNPTVQALGKGSTATDTITVHSADGTPHQITITVNGTNDKAVIGGSNTGAVTEESQLHTSGTLTVTDIDTGEAHFSSTDIIGSLGTLHLTDSGAWTYDLDNTNPTVQALGKGSTATDSITVHSADGTPHQVTITVNGTNDNAVISGSNTGAVTEESQLQTSGTLTVTDVDTGEAHFSNTNIVGTLGTLHLTDNGAWTYDLDNTNPTVQALGKGATATDTITVHSADGTPHQVTITVNGTNDKAVIGGSNTSAVTEETQLHTSGTLTVTDVDTGEAHFSNTNIVGTLGTLHLTNNGNWTYDLDNTNPTVQALGKGATATDTITVHSVDSTPHQITITVNGTNDAAVISGSNTGAVTEESQLQASGTLTVTDVDTGEAHFSNTNIVGTLGTLHLTDNGNWTYDLDNTNPTVQA